MQIILWLLLICGAFILNLLGMMNLIPKVITLPFLFIVLYMFIYSIFQKNSYRRIK